MIFNPNYLIILFFFVSSCKLQSYNSNSNDQELGGMDCSDKSGSELRFCNAQNVIIKRCVSCHSSYHTEFAAYDEDDYIDNFLILPGDSAGSPLFSILLNEGGTMPKDGSPLPTTEYEYLMEWIDQAE